MGIIWENKPRPITDRARIPSWAVLSGPPILTPGDLRERKGEACRGAPDSGDSQSSSALICISGHGQVTRHVNASVGEENKKHTSHWLQSVSVLGLSVSNNVRNGLALEGPGADRPPDALSRSMLSRSMLCRPGWARLDG